ncbi:WAS/WASL-interacting protein family member 2-like [Penaeus vannamei]|uniref:WAS/WASL-interacting protein family member 2-like n=1 Tax=Penaeus vannamei TaxID=6689 RepID=UPI00387FA78A
MAGESRRSLSARSPLWLARCSPAAPRAKPPNSPPSGRPHPCHLLLPPSPPPPRTAPPRGAPPAPCGPCGPAAAASAAGDNNWVEASGFRRRQRPGTHVHLVPANFTSHQVSVANLSGCEGGGARRVHTMLQPGRFCRRTPPPSRYRSAHMTPPALGPPSPPPMSRKCKPSCNSEHGEQNPVLMKAPEHCPL